MEVLTLLMLLKQTYCREIIYPITYRNELHETHSKTPFSWLRNIGIKGTRAPLTVILFYIYIGAYLAPNTH